MVSIRVDISYSQIAVFAADLAQPLNNWTDAHVAQGFSWRPGSVSFSTLDQAGEMQVEVCASTDSSDVSKEATRVICVPFSVPECGEVEIASILSSTTVTLEPGEYQLKYEHGRDRDNVMWAKFVFVRSTDPVEARVLKADSELHPGAKLVMSAEPA